MKYVGVEAPDPAAVQKVIDDQRRQRRRLHLAMMGGRDIRRLYHRMMRDRGSVVLMGGPVTTQDYIDEVYCMERADEVAAAHLAERGPGHESCPTIDFKPVCDR